MNRSIEWAGQTIRIIDQTLLPNEKKILTIDHFDEVIEAIMKLRIRGAPAIGVMASYGLVLSMIESKYDFHTAYTMLKESRPTAVNLVWALDKMRSLYNENAEKDLQDQILILEEMAQFIHQEDEKSCSDIGENGNELIGDSFTIMTICNTGFLATGGIGTALGVIQKAFESGKNIHVYVTETRPLLQGSRLTTWELKELGIPFTLITDSMAAHVMKIKKIDCIITGADRIASNGDSANKIGTYSLAILAKHHQIPFYIAAPLSTFDFSLKSGDEIPIEQRDTKEITTLSKNKIAPEQINCYNPAFDVTPNSYINAIITEKKVIHQKDFNKILDYKRS